MTGKRKKSSGGNQNKDQFPRIERPLTLTAQVEQTLRRAVEEDVFPGGRLPTSVELADQLGVSRETIRLALESLQKDGLVVKHRRRGTFVNPPTVPTKLRPVSTVIGYLQADYSPESGEAEVVTAATGSIMFNGVMAEAGQMGFQLITRSARILDLHRAYDELTSQARLQGVIFASVAEAKFLQRISGQNIPAILLDHDLHLPKMSSIVPDASGRAKLAVQHLVDLGHQRIAIAQWHETDLNPWHLQGYREGMRQAGLRCRRAWEIYTWITRSGAEQAVETLIETSPRPTAVVCFNNTLAAYMIEAASRRDVNVPTDLSVVGGGGAEVIGLTCTQLDWYELGREAMRMLRRAIDDGADHQPEHKSVAYDLRPSKTTAPPPARSNN